MNKKKKALFFVSPYFGGASRMSITIGKLLDKSQYDVKFVVFGKEVKEIINYVPAGYPYVHLKFRNIWDFVTLRMICLFLKEKPSIVFCSFRYVSFRVIVASKMIGGIKTIVRNENHLDHFRFDKKILMKLTYPFADTIIVQQEEMRDELIDFLPQIKDRVVVCHNYLDTEVIDSNLKYPSPYNENEIAIRFVWAGRVSKEKGQDVLLEAFKKVKNKITDAQLYFLGKYNENDNYYKTLRNYIIENGLQESVHFKGLVKNPHIYEKYADCFVMPSYKEGLPNALVEAMYIGIPVVATSCIPIVERMVDVGQNGFIVKPGDSSSMAEAMMKALKLVNCHTIYKSSSKEEYIKLFS